ncbi:MAG: hypothetical protein AB8I58_16135 [Anaerolineales bacterium]
MQREPISKPIVLPSPNKKYKAVLTYIGEIQADQARYFLSIDGLPYSFAERVFGEVCLWSPESRFLAVQEWKETDEASEPRSCLLLIIDVLARRECIIANVEGTKGVILPESFIGDSLMYTVIYYGLFGMTKSFESKFQYLDGWQTLK